MQKAALNTLRAFMVASAVTVLVVVFGHAFSADDTLSADLGDRSGVETTAQHMIANAPADPRIKERFFARLAPMQHDVVTK